MAITTSSFGRFKRGSGPVMGGMRMVTPKVTANLLKSVDAINKNLVAINKLLSQQAGIKAAQQQKQQEETSRKAENLRRFNVEAALEAPKKIAGFITNAIARPAKSIFNTIKQFLDPFIKFFTLTFIGWFTNGLIKWFQQNKETKQKQLKQFIPKIMTALTVAGGVLLAIQFGIPIIMGTLSAIVTTLPILMGALLNPVTWVSLLGVGAGILLFEGGEALRNAVFEDRAMIRVRKTATQGMKGLGDYKFEKGEDLGNAGAAAATGPGSPTIGTTQDYIKVGGSYIRKEDFMKLETAFDAKFDAYEKTAKGKFKRVGQTQINASTLSSNTDTVSRNLLPRLQANKLASFYRNYQMDRKSVTEAKAIMDREKEQYDAALQRATAGGQSVDDALKNDPSLRALKKQSEKNTKAYEQAVNTFNTTQTTIKTLYDRLPEQSRRYLENDLGISKENIYDPKTLEVGQAEYSLQRFERAVRGAIASSPIVQTIQGQVDTLRTNVSAFIDTGVDIVANIEIKPDYQEGANDPVSLGPPTAISPLNIEDPFLQYSKKMYNAWGVI